MRKLIEKLQNSLVSCDNPNCDYTVPYTDATEKYLVLYIDKPCPKCGENLLTIEDYLQHQNLMKVVNYMNRWFSWITIFYSKKAWAKRQSVSVHVHDGVKVSQHEAQRNEGIEQLCQCEDAPTKHFINNWCDDCQKHIV